MTFSLLPRLHRGRPAAPVLAALAIFLVAALLPAPDARAAAPQVRTQAPGYYRLMVGDLEVTALLDANDTWPEKLDELFPSVPAAERAAVHERTRASASNDFSTIAFLVNTGHRLALIDSGGGDAPGYGHLFENLRAAGYAPEQVDDIYITHMHPDHVAGLDAGGRRAFPNAVVHADVHELAQWQAAAARGNATARGIVAHVAPYVAAGRYQTFDGDTRFSPELRAVASHGHTEGHSFYVIESRGQRLRFWGDFVVDDKLQLEKPDAEPPGEKDVAAGVALRRREFADAAASADLVAGAHFAFPGIGHLRSLGDRYVWVPVDWALTAAAPAADH